MSHDDERRAIAVGCHISVSGHQDDEIPAGLPAEMRNEIGLSRAQRRRVYEAQQRFRAGRIVAAVLFAIQLVTLIVGAIATLAYWS